MGGVWRAFRWLDGVGWVRFREVAYAVMLMRVDEGRMPGTLLSLDDVCQEVIEGDLDGNKLQWEN